MKVVTITGIRPDFIRMSEIFRKLDEKFEHILIHTGQHFDKMLSDVFFEELQIRQPDYNLNIGGPGKEHYHQTGELIIKLPEILKSIKPDLVLFLGDSNSVLVAPVLKKEGYRIGHIEAGMRSYDRRMLEETNRVACDHCSDLLFVYHEDYRDNLTKENVTSGVHVVGNTIVETCNKYVGELGPKGPNNTILMDIHRPENFNYPARMKNIIAFANMCAKTYNAPVKMLKFGRTLQKIKEYGLDLGEIELVDLMSHKNFLIAQRDAKFMISDSGTAQEEPALLGTKVLVPRDYTERPQSVQYNCSYMVNMNSFDDANWVGAIFWIDKLNIPNTNWLGNGRTSESIIEIIGNNE